MLSCEFWEISKNNFSYRTPLMAVSASSYCKQNGNNEDVSYLHNEKFFITLVEKETISGRFNFFIYIKQKLFRSKNTNNVKAMLWSSYKTMNLNK